MSVHEAEPMDIYVDKQGKLWRCVGICREPTVIMEEVEGHTPEPHPNFGAAIACTQIIKDRKFGGVTGLMWDGWKRIFRNEPTI